MFTRTGWKTAAALITGALALFAASPRPALAAPPSAEAQKAMDKLGWKLSCQAYTFRALTLFETIDTVQKLGIRYIEMYPGQRLSAEHGDVPFDHNLPPDLIAAVTRKLKSAGVTPMCYGVVGINGDEAHARRVFQFAKDMKIETIVTEPPETQLPMLDRLAREYKVRVALHNHPKPSHYWNPETVLKAVDGLSSRVGACADTGHWYRSGLVPVEALRSLKGRIVSLHFKDLNPEKQDVPWGTGVCNVPAMLVELKAQGVRPVFSIEYESTTGQELYDNVDKCVNYFHNAAIRLAR